MWEAIAGAVGSKALDFAFKKKEQKWAKQSANRQMDFQERMSNTAYQRAMADMRKAGVNPIMVTKLGGASTPTGAMARTPDLGNMGSDMIKNYATAQQVKLTNAQTNNTNAQTSLHSANAKKADTDRRLAEEKIHTEKQVQINKRIDAQAKRIANSMSAWELAYFKKLGYPPKVLVARVENVIGTYVWEKLPEDQKVHFTQFVYEQLRKMGSKVNDFTKEPNGWLKEMWRIYQGLNLQNMYTKGIPK